MNLPTSRARRENLFGYLFAAPWLIGFGGLTLVSMTASLFFSLIHWDGINVDTIRWAGVDNYARALGDGDVAIALWNTAYYSFVSVPLGLAFGLALAMLLNQPLKGVTLFRTIFYMPAVVGGVATIMMWIWIFNPDYGLLNSALYRFCDGLAALGWEAAAGWRMPSWIFSQDWAMPSLILMSLWGTGSAMLIFLAALQNVPDSLYEASDLDGAGRWAKFRYVTVPQISPALFFNLVMGVIGSFQVFTQAFLMTNGGPNKATLFYVLYLYNKAFSDFELGYASALAWILFLIILALTALIFRSGQLWVYYEGE